MDTFDPTSDLCYGDVQLFFDSDVKREYVALTLKSSKCDPFRQGCTLTLFSTGGKLCPVYALKQYLSVIGNSDVCSPLFKDKLGNALTRKMFLSCLDKCLTVAGYDSAQFNGHSFRKGLATSCETAGIGDNLICVLGRWRSQCYKLYMDTPKSVVAKAQCALSDPNLCAKF